MSRDTQMLQWCLALCLVTAHSAQVSDKYAAAGVKPDVVSVAPPNLLQVEFPETGPVGLGDTLQVSKTSSKPSVSFPGADSGQLYTIAMVDPDAPSRKNPRAAQWNHWLVTNIEGSALAAGEVDGKVLMKYSGPAPPQGSGPHRYVLLVYRQEGRLNSRVSRARARFDIGVFAKKNKLGDPVAGNFFYAENQ